jgi:hypothetical protein
MEHTMELHELYSKWELNEVTGDRFRTISLHTTNYSHVFAMEKLSAGHRHLYMSNTAKFSGASAEYKRLNDIRKVFAASVTYGDDHTAVHNKALL